METIYLITDAMCEIVLSLEVQFTTQRVRNREMTKTLFLIGLFLSSNIEVL